MFRIRFTCILLLAWLFAAGCGTSLSTENSATISVLEVHIQQGFEKYWLFIEDSNGGCLQTFVESFPARPGFYLIRYIELHSSQGMAVIRRVPSDGNRPSQSCCIPLQLDPGQDYILNLTAENNEIQATLQEASQQYL
jgi:hypothetical protein